VERYQVVAVYTQPDRPAGRSRRLRPSPVKQAALEHGLPILQPRSLRSQKAAEELRALEPEAVVVAAYGLILPPAVLEVPPFGCLNLHASLLPRYRGAAPVSAAILAGEERTGVSLMLMDEGVDTGPILAQREVLILPQDTQLSLTARLSHLAADLAAEALPLWFEGQISPRPQYEPGASYAPPIRREDGLIDWKLSAEAIERRARAFHPWPGTFTLWKGAMLKILAPQVLGQRPSGEPGQVVALKEGIAVCTGEDLLLLGEVQLAGRRRMGAGEFARGQKDFIGAMLGK